MAWRCKIIKNSIIKKGLQEAPLIIWWEFSDFHRGLMYKTIS